VPPGVARTPSLRLCQNLFFIMSTNAVMFIRLQLNIIPNVTMWDPRRPATGRSSTTPNTRSSAQLSCGRETELRRFERLQ